MDSFDINPIHNVESDRVSQMRAVQMEGLELFKKKKYRLW